MKGQSSKDLQQIRGLEKTERRNAIMFDLHAHILPGLDDGSRNEEISLAMAVTANGTGTRQIVAAPHVMDGAWRPLWTDISTSCKELQSAVLAAGLNLSILPGAEVMLYPDILDLITSPGPYCINGGRYMLVELPPSVIPFYADEFLFILQIRGIRPVLAHPERHLEIRNDQSILKRWIERGVLVQMNGSSLMGRFGDKVKAAAETLLKQDMVHCIGSDAHNNLSRSPDLAMVRKRIRELIGPQRAERILSENPECIVHSRDIENRTFDVTEYYEKKSMFSW